jgi:hypothetical protein
MSNSEFNDFDKYFAKWWLNNQQHFSFQIENQIVDDNAVKTICALDHFLNGFTWEMNSSVVALLHGYFAENSNK